MVKITVYCNGKVARIWKAEDYEVMWECGYEIVYIENDGIRTKVVTAGWFGGNNWGYDVERVA